MPALYLVQMNPEGRALYLKLPHPRHLFLLQLIPPVSTSLWSVGLEHSLLRLPDLPARKRFTARTPSPPAARAAVTDTPGSDQQLYHHQRTRLPPESAAESPVSDRGTPASRTDTQRERKMWRRQMEDAGGAERLQVETANPWLSCAQQARGDLPGRRHALASNLRHTKGQRWPRPP